MVSFRETYQGVLRVWGFRDGGCLHATKSPRDVRGSYEDSISFYRCPPSVPLKSLGPPSLLHFDPVFAEIVLGSGITDLPPDTHDGGRAARMAEPQE